MPYKNKEDQRKWVLANRERIREHQRKWRKNNKEYDKSYGKDGFHRVYLLEDYNYIGVTNNVKRRFSVHKYEHNRDCTNHRILYKSKNRDECLELEELLHDLGYEGRSKHSSYK